MLLLQFDQRTKDKAFRKLLLGRLTEQRESLQKVTAAQEANGKTLLTRITDPHFRGQSSQFRAIVAVSIGRAYYLDVYGGVNGSVFCGIDLETESSRYEIKVVAFRLLSLAKEFKNNVFSAITKIYLWAKIKTITNGKGI